MLISYDVIYALLPMVNNAIESPPKKIAGVGRVFKKFVLNVDPVV